MLDGEIVGRVERRRKWTAAEKAALLAEVVAEGGKVALVARRHRMSESLLYNWRSALKAAAAGPEAMPFVSPGVLGQPGNQGPLDPTPLDRRPAQGGAIEIALTNGARVRVDASVSEKALSRVLRAMKGAGAL